MSAENIMEFLPPEIVNALNKENEGKEGLQKVHDVYHEVKLHQEKTQEHLCKTLICLGVGLASSAFVPGAGLVFLPEFVRQVNLERRNGKILTSSEIEYNEALDHLLSLIPEEELDKLDY